MKHHKPAIGWNPPRSATLAMMACGLAWSVIGRASAAEPLTEPLRTATADPLPQLVSFPSGDLALHGFLYLPAGEGPFPAMIWNHGSEKLPGSRPELARFYTRQGFVFFVPHRQGHGHSPGEYIGDLQTKARAATKDDSEYQRKVIHLHELYLRDTIAAVNWLRQRLWVDTNRMVMSGVSYGGIQTILAAETDLPIKAYVPFAPGAMSGRPYFTLLYLTLRVFFDRLVVVKKRRLMVCALGATCLLAGILYVSHSRQQTYYQGRSVKNWAKLAVAGDSNAAAALKAMGSDAVPDLLKLLHTQDSSVHKGLRSLVPELPSRLRGVAMKRIELPMAFGAREEAARSLGIIGPEARSAVPALAQALRDPNHQVCYDAANAMARIGKDSVPALVEALGIGDPNRRHSIIHALAQIGPEAEAAVPALIQQLKDPDPNIREAVAYTLPQIGAPGLLELIEVIEHGQGPAREVAARELLLFRSAPGTAAPALLQMAQDEAPSTRRQAIETLSALHSIRRPAIDMFIAALKDPIAEVRIAAIKALRQTGTPAQRAVPALVPLLEDKEESVRNAAKEALQTIKTAQPGMAMEKTAETK